MNTVWTADDVVDAYQDVNGADGNTFGPDRTAYYESQEVKDVVAYMTRMEFPTDDEDARNLSVTLFDFAVWTKDERNPYKDVEGFITFEDGTPL